MGDLRFPHVLRGVLVALALIFGVIQIALMTAGPPERPVEPVLPLLSGSR